MWSMDANNDYVDIRNIQIDIYVHVYMYIFIYSYITIHIQDINVAHDILVYDACKRTLFS